MFVALPVCLTLLLAVGPALPELGVAETAHSPTPTDQEQFVVVAFLGVDCPLARLYAPRLKDLAERFAGRRVRFLGVDPNEHDSLDEVAEFRREFRLQFPIVRDVEHRLVAEFDADRTPQVFVVDRAGRIVYRGRIDDQYGLGIRRDSPMANDLADALDSLLAGRRPTQTVTQASGCAIARRRRSEAAANVDYDRDVRPLIATKCATCHVRGGVGPFELSTYEDAAGRAAMIEEVVASRRMPPWPASRAHGKFANDPSLSDEEISVLQRWIAAGCPPSAATTAPSTIPPLPNASPNSVATHSEDGWKIGRPDVVLVAPQEMRVPAEGLVEYQYIEIDPQFATDRWAAAVEVRPSNRAVVHHCNVFMKPPGIDDVVEQGTLGSVCLTATAAGSEAVKFPPGMAKRIPAGWRLLLVVHYTTIGTPQTDRIRLGLRLVEAAEVEREAATRLIVDEQLQIPPHAARHVVEHTATIERDLLLLALFPHMHLRGKSFRYEAEFPDGGREILLDVPAWDFGWQPRYELAEPRRLPAGTRLRCTAVYDNSADNPNNPDPTKTVVTGPLSTDEMFNAYYDVAPVEAARPWGEDRRFAASLAGVVLPAALLVLWRRRQKTVAAGV
ncbi:MAG: redoxin domain-containing protein [Pirellulales bacterium]